MQTVRSVTSRSSLQTPRRQIEIDGIRGWAALVVLLFHLVWEVFGVIRPSYRSPLIHSALDGTLAVYVFFILSGDALSLTFTDPSRSGLNERVVVKRYFRLVGPILFSSLTVYALMKLGLTFNHKASPIAQRADWFGLFLPFKPSLGDVFRYSLMGVFTDPTFQKSYNPFLWPMGIELVGSLIVFSVGMVYRRLVSPLTVCLSASVYLMILGSVFSLFFVGISLGILRAKGTFIDLQELPFGRLLCAFSLVGLVGFNVFTNPYVTPNDAGRYAEAAVLVFVLYASSDCVGFMRSNASQFLGRISFPLYFMQFPVIASWTSWCLVHSQAHPHSAWKSAPLVIVTSVIITVFVAYGAELLEARYLRALDRWIRELFVPASGSRGADHSPT